ncbi:hypothetical protein GCM10027180_32040 [Microbulbifer echini]
MNFVGVVSSLSRAGGEFCILAPFGCEMVSGCREEIPVPMSEVRAEETDRVVGMCLRAVKGRKSQEKMKDELQVFWPRYFHR